MLTTLRLRLQDRLEKLCILLRLGLLSRSLTMHSSSDAALVLFFLNIDPFDAS